MQTVQTKPPLIKWDVVLSCCVLAAGTIMVVLGAFVGVFAVAFLDYCPPETCSADGAFASVAGGLAVAGVIGTAGLVVSIVRITRRRISWPFAVGALVLSLVALAVGATAFADAVGLPAG